MKGSKFKIALSSLSLSIILCYSTLTFSQVSYDIAVKKVDSLCADYGYAGPGSAVLIIKDGVVVLNKGYGLANLEHEIPISPNTVFDLASVSKMFTGYAISLLLEKGKISLSDDIRNYIPELPDYGHTITIDHLVHHTSGLKNWTEILPLAGWSFDDVINSNHILSFAYAQKKLNFVPGSEYSYSNTGYNLLAELVQRVTGMNFRKWTTENIFKPLQMTSTFFLDDYTTLIPNRATSYHVGGDGQYHVSPNNFAAPGSSSLHSTAADLAKWMLFFENPGELKPVIDRMLKPGKLNNGKEIAYGFSIYLSDYRNTSWIAHEGYWPSFSSYIAFLPEYHLSIVYLNNGAARPSGIVREIASMYVQEQPKVEFEAASSKETGPASVRVPIDILDTYTGRYRTGTGWQVLIVRKGEQLWTQATDEESYPMIALSDSVFRIEEYNNQTMTFHRDQAGVTTQVKFFDKLHPKISGPSTYNPKRISKYLGEYENEELKTSYFIINEGEQLLLSHVRFGKMKLVNVWSDDFKILGGSRAFASSLEFIRDNAGEIDAIKLSGEKFVKKNR